MNNRVLLVIGLLGVGALALADDEPPPDPLARTKRVFGESFATSQSCAQCHSNAPRAKGMRDEKGRAIAPYDLWQSTMMANASRDPLWRAVVSAEAAATPSQRAHIESACMRCHTPMASGELELHPDDYEGQELNLDLLRQPGKLAQLALDGVSCTVCHQIQPDGLGRPQTYSGRWVVKPGNQIFGPHMAPFARPMQRFTGYTPEQGTHVLKAGLCATCHTLFTEAFDAEGQPSGEHLPEQTPFLEWRNSSFGPDNAGVACQSCHVPTHDADGMETETRIARNPGGRDFPIPDRSPFGRHIFVGANTLVPAILRDNAEELGVQASRQAFNATIAAAREQLQGRTAILSILRAKREQGALEVVVQVQNMAGHKLPTAHPTRRVWLRLRVVDAAGTTLFASGEHDAQGRLLGPDGVILPCETRGGPVQPHRDLVDDPMQVVIYEAVMKDTAGDWTWLLTRGAEFGKDSRILPRGWDPEGPDADTTRPRGAAAEDASFEGGMDEVTYRIPLPAESAGPLRIEASLFHQPLGSRYAAELFAYDTPEVKTFRRYYEAADRQPEQVGSTAKRTVE